MLDVKVTYTPAYNPKSNPVERAHRDLKASISALMAECPDQDWEDLLPQALFACRMCLNVSTGLSPFQLLFGPGSPPSHSPTWSPCRPARTCPSTSTSPSSATASPPSTSTQGRTWERAFVVNRDTTEISAKSSRPKIKSGCTHLFKESTSTGSSRQDGVDPGQSIPRWAPRPNSLKPPNRMALPAPGCGRDRQNQALPCPPRKPGRLRDPCDGGGPRSSAPEMNNCLTSTCRHFHQIVRDQDPPRPSITPETTRDHDDFHPVVAGPELEEDDVVFVPSSPVSLPIQDPLVQQRPC